MRKPLEPPREAVTTRTEIPPANAVRPTAPKAGAATAPKAGASEKE